MWWMPPVLARGKMKWETECRSVWAAKLGPGPPRLHSDSVSENKVKSVVLLVRQDTLEKVVFSIGSLALVLSTWAKQGSTGARVPDFNTRGPHCPSSSPTDWGCNIVAPCERWVTASADTKHWELTFTLAVYLILSRLDFLSLDGILPLGIDCCFISDLKPIFDLSKLQGKSTLVSS